MDARRQGDGNPNSSVVAEILKLLANNFYGNQIKDRSRHTVTKYLVDEKSHGAINSKMFKWPYHITDQMYEVELIKSKIEHREPIIVRFFMLQYAKLGMLELYYNFIKKFCDTDKYEKLEMDTDSFQLALSEESLEDVILPKKRAEWDQLRFEDCTDNFTVNATDNFFLELAVMPTRNMVRKSRVSSKKSLDVQKCCVSVAKHSVVMISRLTDYKFSSRGLNKRTLEDSGDGGPMTKYRKKLEESVNVTSTNRGFRTIQHSVATYEQTKKRLSYFYPETIVEEDGIHTKPLHV